MIQRKANKPIRGFTLVEILVAVTILTMIFSIVFGTFFYTVENAEERQEQAALYHRAGFIVNNVSQSVGSAYVPFAGEYGNYHDEEDEELSVFAGKDDLLHDFNADSLSLFTTNPRFGGTEMPNAISYVSYSVESADEYEPDEAFRDENNPLVLKCSSKPLLLEDESYVSEWVLNIRSFELQYFDGSDWFEEWIYEDQGILPRAVKLEIELADIHGASHRFDSVVAIRVNTLLEEAAKEEQLAEEEEEKEAEEEEGTQREQEAPGEQSESLFDEELVSEGTENDTMSPWQ
ncbi:MAG: hypothetical protein Kow0099_05920 [Candidatus Abyssubacteria bacterium]